MLLMLVDKEVKEENGFIVFSKVQAVLFCASLNDYDIMLREDNTQNRMMEALMLFDEVANSNYFDNIGIILFLNKIDLFEEKIKHVDLTVCFNNYTGGNEYEPASQFIKSRFLEKVKNGRKTYTHYTCAINTDNIQFVINSVRLELLNDLIKNFVL